MDCFLQLNELYFMNESAKTLHVDTPTCCNAVKLRHKREVTRPQVDDHEKYLRGKAIA